MRFGHNKKAVSLFKEIRLSLLKFSLLIARILKAKLKTYFKEHTQQIRKNKIDINCLYKSSHRFILFPPIFIWMVLGCKAIMFAY